MVVIPVSGWVMLELCVESNFSSLHDFTLTHHTSVTIQLLLSQFILNNKIQTVTCNILSFSFQFEFILPSIMQSTHQANV